MKLTEMEDDVANTRDLTERYVSARARLMGPIPKPEPIGPKREPPEPVPSLSLPPEPEPDWCPEMWAPPERPLPPLPGALLPDAPLEEKVALVLAHVPSSRTPNLISRLQYVTASVFGVKVRDICGRRRAADVCEPRMIAMAIAKELYPSLSLPYIGRWFGGRDRTTVLHARQKYGPLIRKLIDR